VTESKFIEIINKDILLRPSNLSMIPFCVDKIKDVKYTTKEYWMSIISRAFKDALGFERYTKENIEAFILCTVGVILYPLQAADFFDELYNIHCKQFDFMAGNFLDKQAVSEEVRDLYTCLFYSDDSRITTSDSLYGDYVPYAYVLQNFRRENYKVKKYEKSR